jgi:hypothetical protein
MNKLTLENLQEWVDEVSPVKIDLYTQPYYIISKVHPGIAGGTRTILDNSSYYAILQTFTFKSPTIEIYFGCWNKITNEHTREYKWFESQDL